MTTDAMKKVREHFGTVDEVKCKIRNAIRSCLSKGDGPFHSVMIANTWVSGEVSKFVSLNKEMLEPVSDEWYAFSNDVVGYMGSIVERFARGKQEHLELYLMSYDD